jgi:hypothetical protein
VTTPEWSGHDLVGLLIADPLTDGLLDELDGPLDWTALDAAEAAAAWTALAHWVRWLANRYEVDVREIPPCWPLHPPLVEELSALRTAHRAAFTPDGHPSGPLDWHHSLASVRARLRDYVARTGCRLDTHRSGSTPTWTVSGADAEHLGKAVADDVGQAEPSSSLTCPCAPRSLTRAQRPRGGNR